MSKRFLSPLVLLFCVSVYSAEGYTVVLKNGKVMTGTLISESADSVLFKDDSGTRYSLKKSSLDLNKMTEANAAQPVAASEPVTHEETKPAPASQTKKKARVYTKDDIDRLKEKYGDMDIGEPIEDLADYSEPGVFIPEAYARQLKEAGPRMTETMEELGTLTSSIFTNWEMASSTGGDPKNAVTEYLATESALGLKDSIASSIASLDDLQQRLSRAPKGYEDGYKAFGDAVSGIRNYYNTAIGFGSIENSSFFKSRTDELAEQVRSQIAKLQSWNPPQPVEKKSASPPQETAPQEEENPENPSEEVPESDQPSR